MAKRTRQKQYLHDKAVRKEAERYKKMGFKVRADLPGYLKPKPIGKYKRVPDIEATKRGTRHIVEIETPDSVEKDRDQISSFRRSAAHRRRTKFRLRVVG